MLNKVFSISISSKLVFTFPELWFSTWISRLYLEYLAKQFKVKSYGILST